MTMAQVPDAQLVCGSCGDGFVFTAGEQELYRLRGVAQQPERCPSCVRNRSTASKSTIAAGR